MKGKGILFGIIFCSCVGGLSGPARSESPKGGAGPPVSKEVSALQQAEGKQEVLDMLKEIAPAPRFQYNPSGRRDPFQSFIKPGDQRLEGLPPLQRVSVSQLKLIGVAWSSGGAGAVGAMVQTPDGKTYPVKKGTRIGNNRGRIRDIGAQEVIIEEPYLNIFGRTDLKQVVMKLHKKKEGE